MYEGPLNGAKMTLMDILKFRDINRETLCTKISAILSFLNQWAHCTSPPPGANRVKVMLWYLRLGDVGAQMLAFQYPSNVLCSLPCIFHQTAHLCKVVLEDKAV